MAEGFVALRDRARAMLAQHGAVEEDALLEYVYGARCPPALRARLSAPLLADPRFARSSAGQWTLATQSGQPQPAKLRDLAFSTLAVATTGPRPTRHRIVAVAIAHVSGDNVLGRFDATFNPGRRVPRYVADRSRIATDQLDADPDFASTLDELLSFLDERPVFAQEARQVWAFLEAEARRLGRALPELAVLDVNALAVRLLGLEHSKPTLALVAERLGIGYSQIGQPREEARVLGQVVSRLLVVAAEGGTTAIAELSTQPLGSAAAPRPLRSATTPAAAPDAPGVYFLRDAAGQTLYVGKARSLKTRLAAYVHRALGPTRRLEGLADAVATVEWIESRSDLEALILEERAIIRFQPRYNTQRLVRRGPTWLCLTAAPDKPGRARQSIRLSAVTQEKKEEKLGPFRNSMLARQARDLARQVFDLDRRRKDGSAEAYAQALTTAWAFLAGDTEVAAAAARAGLAQASSSRDHAAVRQWQRLLAEALAYAPATLMLPADPRKARYAVVRPGPGSGTVEVFVVERGRLMGHTASLPEIDTFPALCELLEAKEPVTRDEDVDIVLHWLGAQRPGARLVHLPGAEAELIERAVSEVLEAEAARIAAAELSAVVAWES